MIQLKFRPPILGTDGTFNTFRLGLAWSKRVQAKTVVELVNARTGESAGVAEVISVYSGELHQMLEEHSHGNHSMIALSPEDKPAALLKRLKTAYGTRAFNAAKSATVIYMRKL